MKDTNDELADLKAVNQYLDIKLHQLLELNVRNKIKIERLEKSINETGTENSPDSTQ